MPDVTREVGNQVGRTAQSFEQQLDEKMPRPKEGEITHRIERQTAKTPSILFLIAAGASVLGSVALFARRRPLSAIFVGLWPPTFLLLGNYNKMVKLISELETGRTGGYGPSPNL